MCHSRQVDLQQDVMPAQIILTELPYDAKHDYKWRHIYGEIA